MIQIALGFVLGFVLINLLPLLIIRQFWAGIALFLAVALLWTVGTLVSAFVFKQDLLGAAVWPFVLLFSGLKGIALLILVYFLFRAVLIAVSQLTTA
jgi:hypothetical protein